MWRGCQLRVFTVCEDIAPAAVPHIAARMREMLQSQQIFHVDVEIIVQDEVLAAAYTHDSSVQQRESYLQRISAADKTRLRNALPFHIDALLPPTSPKKQSQSSDIARGGTAEERRKSLKKKMSPQKEMTDDHREFNVTHLFTGLSPEKSSPDKSPRHVQELVSNPEEVDRAASFKKLNAIVCSRSKRAELIVMNLPDVWGNDFDDALEYVTFCNELTNGLERVLFMRSTGKEIIFKAR